MPDARCSRLTATSRPDRPSLPCEETASWCDHAVSRHALVWGPEHLLCPLTVVPCLNLGNAIKVDCALPSAISCLTTADAPARQSEVPPTLPPPAAPTVPVGAREGKWTGGWGVCDRKSNTIHRATTKGTQAKTSAVGLSEMDERFATTYPDEKKSKQQFSLQACLCRL